MEDKRKNADYQILQSLTTGHTEFVLGENLNAAQPYVTWQYTNNDYALGHYFGNFADAMSDLLARTSAELDNIRETQTMMGAISPPLGVNACLKDSKYEDYTGKLLILNPNTLLAEYRRSEHQLYTASSGFGCSPDSNGRKVFCTSLFDGHNASWNRHDFMGIADPAKLPAWANEKLAVQQAGNQVDDESEMEL